MWREKQKLGADWFPILLGSVNIIIGLTIFSSWQYQAELYQTLRMIIPNENIWAMVFIFLGTIAIGTTVENSRRGQIVAFGLIGLFWIGLGIGWAQLDYIPSHATANLMMNVSGSVFTIRKQWKRRE